MSLEQETIKRMRSTYGQLFKGNDPFTEVFTDELPNRLILCPTKGYFLTDEQYLALIRTMGTLGESSFFISEVEGEHDVFNNPGHWRINVDTPYEDYCQLPIYLENAIYSEAGNWGLIISHEEHALFGGSHYATQLFKDNLTNWRDGKTQFNVKWEHNKKLYGSEVGWISGLISHIEEHDCR